MADETADDISLMVAIMARSIGQRNNLMDGLELWQLAGRILCPIFDYAKPEAYVAAMTATRQDYAGVASDGDMQRQFAAAVEELAYNGVLDSLDSAIANRAWEGLQRRRPVER